MSSSPDSLVANQSPIRQRTGVVLDLLAVAAVVSAALAAYWHATGYYFSQDDFTFLARAKGIQPYPGLFDPFGTRVISARLFFLSMHGLFGLEAGPYHWASLLLHALNAALVYAVARCWTGSKLVALVSGLLFAASDIAFTAVFWISGVQDLLATTFLLLAALIWSARPSRGWMVAALSAVAMALSLLSKSVGVLFPAVLFLMARARPGRGRRTIVLLAPHAAISLGALALLLAQSSGVREGGAYEAGITAALPHNLATYVAWTADVIHPFKDRVAMIDFDAWKRALPIGVVLALFMFTSRGKQARMQWGALGWYFLCIAPVLPLLRHTYLYYIYPAMPGAAILAGLAVYRMASALSRRFGSLGLKIGWATGLGAAAVLCAIGISNVRARENARLEPDFTLPHDHVLRSSVLAENAASTFAESGIPRGVDLLLINPYSPLSSDLAKGVDPEAKRATFDMVRAALRGGSVLRLLRPDLGDIEFAQNMRREWENRHALVYDGFGRLTYIGTGADIWANLSTFYLSHMKRIDESMSCSKRALELNPDQPRANLNLGAALVMTGSPEEARVYLQRALETSPIPGIREDARKWLRRLEQE